MQEFKGNGGTGQFQLRIFQFFQFLIYKARDRDCTRIPSVNGSVAHVERNAFSINDISVEKDHFNRTRYLRLKMHYILRRLPCGRPID